MQVANATFNRKGIWKSSIFASRQTLADDYSLRNALVAFY